MSLEIKYSQKIRVSPTSHFHDRYSESGNDKKIIISNFMKLGYIQRNKNNVSKSVSDRQ